MTLTICSTIFAQSRQLSEQEALTVALNRLKKDYPGKTVIITGVNKKFDNHGNTILYEVETSEEYAILLSGHRACLPILGIHNMKRGSIVNDFESLPCGYEWVDAAR